MVRSMSSIQRVHLSVPEVELDALKRRLGDTRWPDAETSNDWSQGVPVARMRALIERWAGAYDWRRCETMLNLFGLYATEIDGLLIHFLHIRSPRANALPLLLTHGWPGSIIEFHGVIEPLVTGEPGQIAFDLVIPCLPGYGFSQKPKSPGWTVERIARAWVTLMATLGFEREPARGGDWGAAVTVAIAKLAPPQLAGIHLNMPLVIPPNSERGEPEEQQQTALKALELYGREENAYARLQATRPQTMGYGLVDSP